MKTFYIVLIESGEDEELAIETAEYSGDYFNIIEVSDDLYKQLGFTNINVGSIVLLGDWDENIITDKKLKELFDNIFDEAEYQDKYPYALIR